MIGISGTGRTGKLHYYYVCQKKRSEKTCDKKNVRRDEVEYQIAKAIFDNALQDQVIEWIADSTIAYNDRKEAEGHIGILEDQLADVQRSLKNIMSAIEQGIVTETTKSRLLELESERSEIEGKIAAAKADIVPVNREQLIEWLLSLREGDIHDKKYQARLFDTFLIAAYLYDDGTAKLVFSFAGDKNTVTVPLAEAVDSVEENTAEGSFKLCLAPPKQYNPNLLPIGHGFGFVVSVEEIEDW